MNKSKNNKIFYILDSIVLILWIGVTVLTIIDKNWEAFFASLCVVVFSFDRILANKKINELEKSCYVLNNKFEQIKIKEFKDDDCNVPKKIEFSDNLLWSFDYTLAIIIRDGLRQLSQNIEGHPIGYEDDEQWKEELISLSNKFDKYVQSDENLVEFLSEQRHENISQALKELADIYDGLWY